MLGEQGVFIQNLLISKEARSPRKDARRSGVRINHLEKRLKNREDEGGRQRSTRQNLMICTTYLANVHQSNKDKQGPTSILLTQPSNPESII